MILVVDIFGAAIGVAAGAGLCFLLFVWKNRRAQAAEAREAHSLLEKARQEAAAITNSARLAASEDAVKLRNQAEQSLTERRSENAAQERRLSERETLLNSQLTRIIEAEKDLKQQKEALDRKATAVENVQQELIELTRQRREQLQALAGISSAEARSQFLKEIEQEAMKDAGNLTARFLMTEGAGRGKGPQGHRRGSSAGDQTFENTTATWKGTT
jgi:ribonuclease Y